MKTKIDRKEILNHIQEIKDKENGFTNHLWRFLYVSSLQQHISEVDFDKMENDQLHFWYDVITKQLKKIENDCFEVKNEKIEKSTL